MNKIQVFVLWTAAGLQIPPSFQKFNCIRYAHNDFYSHCSSAIYIKELKPLSFVVFSIGEEGNEKIHQ